MVVQIALALQNASARPKQGGNRLLGGCFAGAACYGDDGTSPQSAHFGGKLLQRRERVRHRHQLRLQRGSEICTTAAFDNRPDRSCAERLWNVIVPIQFFAANSEE